MIDIKTITDGIEYWLQPVDSLFTDFRHYALDHTNKRKRRIFIDKGSPVLFIAHLDTVQKPKFYKRINKRIYAAGLDDRLGAMLAFKLSNELNADLLLTDLEESISTTAFYHDCKDYNWIVEFDRAGSDVVTYGLDNPEFMAALSERWKIGFGSYSDIVDLNADACCFNLGIGYEQAHSVSSYAEIKTIETQVSSFIEFFNEHWNTKFVRNEKTFYEDEVYDPDSGVVCEVCGSYYGDAVFGHIICEDCVLYMLEQQGVYRKIDY